MKCKGKRFIFLLVRNKVLPSFLESLVPAVVLNDEENDPYW